MKISISGKQLDIGTALQEHVEDSLNQQVKKYFDNPIGANVSFSKARHVFAANIMVNEGTGNNIIINANGEGADAYAAFEKALERISKRLRRYKRKIQDHHKARSEKEKQNFITATNYILADNENEEEPEQPDAPLIIAEKAMSVDEMTVSDAVMHMDLSDIPALLFINSKTKSISLVYRREDGNISWTDSGLKQTA